MSVPAGESWGVIVPGRPNTPSDGAAQIYNRVGSSTSRNTRVFKNRTVLTLGPDDPIDEFDIRKHPFSEQITAIDTALKNCLLERIMHPGAPPTGPSREEDRSRYIEADDIYNNFRNATMAFQNQVPRTAVHLDSGIYLRVPSRYVLSYNEISYYMAGHKGIKVIETSTDPRYGSLYVTQEDSVNTQYHNYNLRCDYCGRGRDMRGSNDLRGRDHQAHDAQSFNARQRHSNEAAGFQGFDPRGFQVAGNMGRGHHQSSRGQYHRGSGRHGANISSGNYFDLSLRRG